MVNGTAVVDPLEWPDWARFLRSSDVAGAGWLGRHEPGLSRSQARTATQSSSAGHLVAHSLDTIS